jgi:NitT/TauT family transport system ATP-binding protein
MTARIDFSHVSKSYVRPSTRERVVVLENFSLQIASGELVAIVGSSGIGKTTLMHLAAGLDAPDHGTVSIGATGGHAGHGVREPRVGVVFQQPRLLDWLTVADNVAVAARAAAVDPERGRQLLATVGLGEHERAYPLMLSGGQRQRVALARAFGIEPDIVLLDEPFSALDELTARHLRIVLRDIWHQKNATGILITHNTLEAVFLADRVVVLAGPPARIERIVEIKLAHPRSPDDMAIFSAHREIIASLEGNSWPSAA